MPAIPNWNSDVRSGQVIRDVKRMALFAALICAGVAAFFMSVVWYLSRYQGGTGTYGWTMGRVAAGVG